MRNFLRSRWHLAPARRRGRVRPRLERLESRIVFALPATPLTFTPFGTAHAAALLSAPGDFQLYRVHLGAGDVVNAAVSSQAGGGALQSNLRVFDATGRPLALDAQQGGDPRLTFQAPASGDYLVGVSSAGDDAYDPAVPTSGHGGVTTGLYDLDLQRKPAAPLKPDLAGGSFRLQMDAAAYGDTVSGTFTADNRGGADAGPFAVQVVLSADNLFGPSSQVLTTFALAGLGAGREFTPGVFAVTLPDLAAATGSGLPVSGPVYLGLRIDPAGVVRELNHHDQSGVHAGEDWQALTVVTPITASGNNLNPASAQALADLNSRVSGVLAAGQTDWYQITVPANSRLTATVTASDGSSLLPRLTLTGSGGQVLIQSDGSLVQHLPPGTYEVAVSAQSGAGRYQLTAESVPASTPFEPLWVGSQLSTMVVADVNGDGKPDLIVDDLGTYNPTTHNYNGGVSVLLGRGDGTFGPPQIVDGGSNPFSVAVADVNGDGKPDLVVSDLGTYNPTTHNLYDHGVSVLLGKGDGTFGTPQTIDAGSLRVSVADVSGDGKPDLIVDNLGTYNPTTHNWDNGGVSVLLGKGDGTFGPPKTLDTGSYALSVAVADVNGDGKPDIIVANQGTYNPTTHKFDNRGVSVLLGKGDGTFQKPQTFDANPYLVAVAVADVNGDGKPDLIVAHRGTYDPTTGKPDYSGVDVLLGKGDGTFGPPQTFNGGSNPFSVAVADVNGDGKPDLVTTGSLYSVGVWLGKGDGAFQRPQTFSGLEFGPSVVVEVADVNGDGKPDLVVLDGFPYSVDVMLNNGDGTFQFQQLSQGFPVGLGSYSVAVADVNGDGIPDVVTANIDSESLSVLLGNGDSTFQPQQATSVIGRPQSVAVADVNGDGRPDLVATEENAVSVLLGNGDGTFGTTQTIDAGPNPILVAAADVNGDGKPDLVVSGLGTYNPTTRSFNGGVLLGKGDGTFGTPQTLPAGTDPFAVADVNGDGKPDLVVWYNRGLSVLLGNGDGTFGTPQTIDAANPNLVVAADVNGDGKPDLVVSDLGTYNPTTHNWYNGGVSVLLGRGDGSFGPPQTVDGGSYARSVAVADVNGDGKPDLIVANQGTYNPTTHKFDKDVLLGKGDGTFFRPRAFVASYNAGPMVVADVNGDGRPDLVATEANTVSVQLGSGDGLLTPTFTPVSAITAVSRRSTPYLTDLTGDGLLDSVVLNGAGAIFFRKGLPGADNPFDPPIILNSGRSARDLTVLQTATGLAAATADARFDPALSSPSQFVYTVSLYRDAANGTFHRTTAFATTLLPTRITAADLTGNGLDDLIVANSFDNSIQVALQQSDGTFSAPLTLPTGQDPSDITVADFDGDGLPDIAVSNQASGDVSVFLNDPQHSFAQSYRFRAGTGLYGLDTTGATPTITSLEQSVSLAIGDFTGQGRNDLLVVNRGSDSFTVLPNDGQGGFADPHATLTTSIRDGSVFNSQAGPVVAGHFRGLGQPLDIAILMKDRAEVWVFSGNGDGTFTHTFTLPAGAQPTGLNLVRNPQTGLEDLLVGDPFGDVLHLQGKGDGTFQVAGRRTALAAQDLGNGQTDVLVANQQSDRITIQANRSGSPQLTPVVTLADGTHSTLAPGAVQWAKLDKASPFFDAVVVASGGNEVLVYRGTGFDAAGNPTFAAPVSYPVGTNPVSVTIQDLNGDGIPDMVVANQGSNDVSILFGSWDSSGNWVGTAGPRLQSHGSGPIAAQAVFPAGGGLPQLVITNGQSGTLAVLPGVGQGFFNDQSPQIINLPGNPVLTQGPTFGASGLGVVVTATGQLIGFNLNDLAGSVGVVFTPPPGEEVAAAQALANGHVVAVLSTGEVVDLAPSGGGLAVDATFVPQSGIPSEPSALEVLQGESGLQALVTGAGGDQVFEFLLPGPAGPPLLPEPSLGPIVEVTPPPGEVLTVVVTLTAGTGSSVAVASADGTPGGGVAAAEAAVASEGGAAVAGATAGSSQPAWGLGLMAAAPAGAAPAEADPAEDAVGEVPLAETTLPKPSEDGLDLEKQLREQDLYRPTPDPDRPGPLSGRPRGRRGPTLIAQAPADPGALPEVEEPSRWWAQGAEVVRTVAAGLGPVTPTDLGAADAVFALAPPSWSVEGWRLLGLAGLALYPWPHGRSSPEGNNRTNRRARRAIGVSK
jgi:hypothetical protein